MDGVIVGESHSNTMAETCKATIQQGVSKGTRCWRTPSDNGYCGKHAVRFLVENASAEGHRICDDARRKCRNYTLDGKVKCEDCLEKIREIERVEHTKKRENGLCLGCGCELDELLQGARGKVQRCEECYEKLITIESKRTRERNYLAERKDNLERHYKVYNIGATKRNLSFNISIEAFETLVNSPCEYCGYHQDHEAIGVDRIDNTRGYEDDNVVPCCKTCNRMKGDLTLHEFTSHIEKIIGHYVRQEIPAQVSVRKSYVPPKKILEYYRNGTLSEYIQRCIEDERNPLFIEKLTELTTVSRMSDVACRTFIKNALKLDNRDTKMRINPKELFGYLKLGQIEKCIELYAQIHGMPEGFREDIEILIADWNVDEEINQKAFYKLLIKYQNKRNR